MHNEGINEEGSKEIRKGVAILEYDAFFFF